MSDNLAQSFSGLQISSNAEVASLQKEYLALDLDWRKSKFLAETGVYKYTQGQIFLILQNGRDLGMTSNEALQGLYIIQSGVQMFGSAKTAYLVKRGWRIEYFDEEFSSNGWLTSTTCKISKDGVSHSETITVSQIKNGLANQALKNAPQTKLRYEALNRIIKTRIAGEVPVVVGNSEDDFEVLNVETVQKTETTDELLKFITEECQTLEALEAVKAQVKTDAQKEAYNLRWLEFQPKKVEAPAQNLEIEDVEIESDELFTNNKATKPYDI